MKVHQMTPTLNQTPHIDKQIVEHVVASVAIDIIFGKKHYYKSGVQSINLNHYRTLK
jgi:hypothetical protein